MKTEYWIWRVEPRFPAPDGISRQIFFKSRSGTVVAEIRIDGLFSDRSAKGATKEAAAEALAAKMNVRLEIRRKQ